MFAVALDFGFMLILRVVAIGAAILLVVRDGATASFVGALLLVSHGSFPFLR